MKREADLLDRPTWDGNNLAEFTATAVNEIKIIFCQGVYLAENTSQAASVEFVCLRQTNYARSRLQKLSEKAKGLFRHAEADLLGRSALYQMPGTGVGRSGSKTASTSNRSASFLGVCHIR